MPYKKGGRALQAVSVDAQTGCQRPQLPFRGRAHGTKKVGAPAEQPTPSPTELDVEDQNAGQVVARFGRDIMKIPGVWRRGSLQARWSYRNQGRCGADHTGDTNRAHGKDKGVPGTRAF